MKCLSFTLFLKTSLFRKKGNLATVFTQRFSVVWVQIPILHISRTLSSCWGSTLLPEYLIQRKKNRKNNYKDVWNFLILGKNSSGQHAVVHFPCPLTGIFTDFWGHVQTSMAWTSDSNRRIPQLMWKSNFWDISNSWEQSEKSWN